MVSNDEPGETSTQNIISQSDAANQDENDEQNNQEDKQEEDGRSQGSSVGSQNEIEAIQEIG